MNGECEWSVGTAAVPRLYSLTRVTRPTCMLQFVNPPGVDKFTLWLLGLRRAFTEHFEFAQCGLRLSAQPPKKVAAEICQLLES